MSWITKSPNVDISFQPAVLFYSLSDSPLIFALFVEVDFVDCDEYLSISIPAFPSMTLHYLLIVLVVTTLCGFL